MSHLLNRPLPLLGSRSAFLRFQGARCCASNFARFSAVPGVSTGHSMAAGASATCRSRSSASTGVRRVCTRQPSRSIRARAVAHWQRGFATQRRWRWRRMPSLPLPAASRPRGRRSHTEAVRKRLWWRRGTAGRSGGLRAGASSGGLSLARRWFTIGGVSGLSAWRGSSCRSARACLLSN